MHLKWVGLSKVSDVPGLHVVSESHADQEAASLVQLERW